MEQNLAVIGCGAWGKNLIRNFSELGALRAVCDIDHGELDSFCSLYPKVAVFTDIEGILEDPGIKACVISTPAPTHYAITKKALLAGKDVMVEKPLALFHREAEELVNLADQMGQILMVGHVLLYHPAIAKLKNMIDTGDLGKICYIYSNRLNLGKFRTEENILWSFAPHDISVILHLLNEMPASVAAHGGRYLNSHIVDVTVTSLSFPSGVRSHIFVSWLHPYREQKLVVIGEKSMVLFDDASPGNKLFLFRHRIDWVSRLPVPKMEEAEPVEINDTREPLRLECEHFLECIRERKTPLTGGQEPLRVNKILEACQRSLEEREKIIEISGNKRYHFFLHETSTIDENCEIGEGTKIWHFSHILRNSKIGKKCVIGQNACIGPNVVIGNNVKIQNNVSVYEGVTLEDDVFCGPSMVFTNVINPRSHWPRKDEFQKTLVKQGASLGAGSTIICGTIIGRYAFVGAGALVNKEVPDYALVFGVPARIQGWMCYCGVKLDLSDSLDSIETAVCGGCGRTYRKVALDVSEIPR